MIIYRTTWIFCLTTDNESDVLTQMKNQRGDRVPLLIINPTTNIITVKEFNENTQKLDTMNNSDYKYEIRRAKRVIPFFTAKSLIENKRLDKKEHKELCKLAENKHYYGKKLTTSEENKLKKL